MKVEINLEPRIDPAAARRLQQIFFEASVASVQEDERKEEKDADADNLTA